MDRIMVGTGFGIFLVSLPLATEYSYFISVLIISLIVVIIGWIDPDSLGESK